MYLCLVRTEKGTNKASPVYASPGDSDRRRRARRGALLQPNPAGVESVPIQFQSLRLPVICCKHVRLEIMVYTMPKREELTMQASEALMCLCPKLRGRKK